MKAKQVFLSLLVLGIVNVSSAQMFKKLREKLNKSGSEEKEQVLEADLHLQNKADPAVTQVGGTVTFTIAVNNKGPETSKDIVARVVIPKSYRIDNINVSQGKYSESTRIWDVGSLEAWKRAEMKVSAIVADDADLMTTGEIINCSTKDPDSTPGNGIDTNGNGLIIDDREDEDDADGQDVKLHDVGDAKTNNSGITDPSSLNMLSNPVGNAGARESTPSDQSSSEGHFVNLPESYVFSFQGTLRITNNKGTREVIYFMEPGQNYYAKGHQTGDISGYTVFDNARDMEVYLAEVEGKKRKFYRKMDLVSKARQIGAFQDVPGTKTASIGSRTISGFECKGYKITSGAGTTELWVTNQAPATAFGALFGPRAVLPNSPFTKNTMIMEIVFTSADNPNNNYQAKCIEFKPMKQQFYLNDYAD